MAVRESTMTVGWSRSTRLHLVSTPKRVSALESSSTSSSADRAPKRNAARGEIATSGIRIVGMKGGYSATSPWLVLKA